MLALFGILFVFHAQTCCFLLCAVNTVFYSFIYWFPYFTTAVQLLCSLSGWLNLHCSSIGTELCGGSRGGALGARASPLVTKNILL